MDTLDLILTLIPAPDDPPLKTPGYQAELRHFEASLTSNGIEVSNHTITLRGVAADPIPTIYLGDFTIKLVGMVGPPIIAGIAGWLLGRNGRKVHLKVGDIEVDAPTMDEVEMLLARVQKIQQRSQQPTVIP